MINKTKVKKRVLVCWIHTVVSMFTMMVVMFILVGISLSIGGSRLIISIMASLITVSFLIFIFSEAIVVTKMKGTRLYDEDGYPNFKRAIDDLCRNIGMRFRPRIYILEMDKPNACAFGMGVLGQYAVAITKDLYDLLTPLELKAVLSHELGHIRSKDVGLMTLLTIIIGSAQRAAEILKNGKSVFGKSPFGFVFGWLLYLFAKLIFPVGRSAISQERELCADALGASYLGTAEPLISALLKIHESLKSENGSGNKGPFDDLFITHPGLEARIRNLKNLMD